LYLIKSNDAYTKVTKVIVDSLKERLPKLLEIDESYVVNFAEISKIYETFVEIIRKEKSIGDTELYIDVTSAPRLSTLAAYHLGELFDITIIYTGSQINREPIDDPDTFLKERKKARDDPGIKSRYYRTHFRELEPLEKKLLL